MQTKHWDNVLWAVEMRSKSCNYGLLIGSAWHKIAPPAYEGEPPRPLLFRTRKHARKWCAAYSCALTIKRSHAGTENMKQPTTQENNPERPPALAAATLLACPFCGSKAEMCYTQRRHDFDTAIECADENCGVWIAGKDCVLKWNTRKQANGGAKRPPN